jgi:hypothetical protein
MICAESYYQLIGYLPNCFVLEEGERGMDAEEVMAE